MAVTYSLRGGRARASAEGPGSMDDAHMEDPPGMMDEEQLVAAPAPQLLNRTYKGPEFKALLAQQQQQQAGSSKHGWMPCQEHPGLAYHYGAEGLAVQQGPNGTSLLLPTWEARGAAAAAAEAQNEASAAAAEAARIGLEIIMQRGRTKKGEENHAQAPAAAASAARAAADTAAQRAAAAAASAAAWAAKIGGGAISVGGQGGANGRRRAGASSHKAKGQAGSGLYGFRAFTGLTLPQLAYYAPLVQQPQLVLLKPYEPGSYSSRKGDFARSLLDMDVLGEGAGLPPPPEQQHPSLASTTFHSLITSSICAPAVAAAAAQPAGRLPASGNAGLGAIQGQQRQHQQQHQPLPSCFISLRMRFNVGCIMPVWVPAQICALGARATQTSTAPGRVQVREEGMQGEQQDVDASNDQQQQQQEQQQQRQQPQALWVGKGGKLNSDHPPHVVALTPLQARCLPPHPGPGSTPALPPKKAAAASRKRSRVGSIRHLQEANGAGQEDPIGTSSEHIEIRGSSNSWGVSGRGASVVGSLPDGNSFDLLWEARVPSYLLLPNTAAASPNFPAPSPHTPFPARSQPAPLAGLTGQVTIARGLGSPDDAARAVDLVVLALQPYSTDLAEQLAVLHGSLSARSCQNVCHGGMEADLAKRELREQAAGTVLCSTGSRQQLGCCRMATLQGDQAFFKNASPACQRRFVDFLEFKQQQHMEPRLPPLNFELEEYGAKARRPRRGEELQHFLALLRACPSAASGKPHLPAPLQLHPATLHPAAGPMALPKVGCGGCEVCRDPARLAEPCVWSGLLTGGLQWGAHAAARALARKIAAQQSQVLYAGKILRRSHRAHIGQTLTLRGEPSHWLLPSSAAASTAAATAARAGATQKLRLRAKAGWGWLAAKELEEGQHDQHSSSVNAAGIAAAAEVMAAGLEAAGLGAGQGGTGEDLDALHHVLVAGNVAWASGHPFVALQEPRPSRCKWCSGTDHDVELCPLWGMLQPPGRSVLGTGIRTCSGSSTGTAGLVSTGHGVRTAAAAAAQQQRQGHAVRTAAAQQHQGQQQQGHGVATAAAQQQQQGHAVRIAAAQQQQQQQQQQGHGVATAAARQQQQGHAVRTAAAQQQQGQLQRQRQGHGVATAAAQQQQQGHCVRTAAAQQQQGHCVITAAAQQQPQQGHEAFGDHGGSQAGGRARRHASTRGYLVMGPSLDEGRLHQCKVDSKAVQLPSSSGDPHPPKAMERGLKVLRGRFWRAPKPHIMGQGPMAALLDFDWLVSQEEQVPSWLWDLEPDLVEAMVAIRQAAAWADPALMLDHPQPCLKDGGNLPSLEECLALAVLAQEAAKEEAQHQHRHYMHRHA